MEVFKIVNGYEDVDVNNIIIMIFKLKQAV